MSITDILDQSLVGVSPYCVSRITHWLFGGWIVQAGVGIVAIVRLIAQEKDS